MKKLLVILMSALLCAAFAGVAAAQQSDLEAHVWVNVDPTIAITPGSLGSSIDGGNVNVGIFPIDIPFRVDANKQTLEMWAEVTHLFKGDDTDADAWIEAVNGVEIRPDLASPLGALDNFADFIGPGALIQGPDEGGEIDDFETQLSESIPFESGQNNHFSQEVVLRCFYNQDDPELPMGEYSGFVRFYAMVYEPPPSP